nr:hypothetical protein [Tanacetum cinerariifolium]
MSLEESDDLNISDVALVDPILKAGALPKFDMHLYKSSLNESHVRYLVKLYGILKELHPRVVPEDISPTVPLFCVFYKICKQGNWFSFQNRAGKDCKPCTKDATTSLKKWVDMFFLVDRRAALIAMAWRHHDYSIADPFPRSSEYNASDVAKLREVVISLRRHPLSILYVAVITMAEFLRLPNFKGCKVFAETLLPPGTARILDDKEKKKRNAEEKVAAKAPAANVQVDAVVNKGASKEGPRKKRWVRVGPSVSPDSEHVSSFIPLNQAKPLEALANEEHASPPLSVGHMDTLRDQTDEHAISPRVNEGGQVNVDASHTIEGHVDNEGGLSGLQTRRRLDILEGHAPANIVPDVEANKLLCRPFGQPSLYSSMGAYELKQYGQLAKELIVVQSAYNEKVSAFDQLFKNYDGTLTREKGLQDRLEELEEEKREADQPKSLQADWIKQLEEALKQSEANAQQLRIEKERYVVKASRGEMRYPYVDKVARMYLLDPSGLQNIMPDETGPTPDGGPHDTPIASYA